MKGENMDERTTLALNVTNNADDIQEIALNIYGKYDLDKSLLWMTEEFGEVIKAIHKHDSKEHIVEEIGDLSAWILCLCNILDIKFSDSLKNTFSKEINRQKNTYGDLKYWR
jgi:mazG nucleotide pyrophosphohydrolase domain